MHSDYILLHWQTDDLPAFGRIQSITMVKGLALFEVCVYHTYGIHRHYHSFAISKTGEVATCLLTKLVENQSFHAHLLHDGYLYITFHSHIENIPVL